MNAALVRLITCCVIALVASLANARTAATGIDGLVVIADGGPFTIIRGDELRQGTKGVGLVAGDMVETGPAAFLVVQLQGGSLIGIGPSSAVYFLPHAGTTLIVRNGWLKTDIHAAGQPGATKVLGPRLGIQSQQAVVLLHVDERSDALFDEQGSGTLLLRDTAATRTDQETRPNQFFAREGRSEVLVKPHLSPDFLAKMPLPFQDTLPANAAPGLQKPLEPQPLRKVTYPDIQSWLTIARDWRAGFITRFRGRLKDPAFFAAMDAHLAQYPEWGPILHPKPPDRGGQE